MGMLTLFKLTLLLVFCCVTVCPSFAAAGPVSGEVEVWQGFETILDLWRDGRLGELYDRTYGAGAKSRESFLQKMTHAAYRPACCWEKMRDVRVTISGDGAATLSARIGLERTGRETSSCTRSFRLRREDGVWKASMSDILAIAGASRKKSGRR
jgi:hypothetical protein